MYDAFPGNLANCRFPAFNAALVVYSASLIQGESKDFDQTIPLDQLAARRTLLLRAVDCLLKLDNGNSVTQKCAEYLSTLVRMLESLCQWRPLRMLLAVFH
jgi:hypothetical protein